MDTNEFERALGVLLSLELKVIERLKRKPTWAAAEVEEELRQARIDIQGTWGKESETSAQIDQRMESRCALCGWLWVKQEGWRCVESGEACPADNGASCQNWEPKRR